jgi:hypothetical protein
MNPYLEDPAYWSSIHHRLINQIARSLNPQLRPNYIVAVEVRMYETATQESTLVGIPDNVVVKGDKTGEKSFRTGRESFRTGEKSFRTGEKSFRTGEKSFRTGEKSFHTASQ